MSHFFRFPHTPHLLWLGTSEPRDDKKMSPSEVAELLSDEVVVEEKIDGANLGISLATDGQARIQNRGHYLTEPFTGQFSRLASWLARHRYPMVDLLEEPLILFGEWCVARHSLEYDALPDWFLLFDVYDREHGGFWSSQRRDRLADTLGLAVVPRIVRASTTLTQLREWLESRPSHYRQGAMEGIVVRKEDPDWCKARGKMVQAGFAQDIREHWSRRPILYNRLAHNHGMDSCNRSV